MAAEGLGSCMRLSPQPWPPRAASCLAGPGSSGTGARRASRSSDVPGHRRRACRAPDRRNEVTDRPDEPTSIAAMDANALRGEALAAITAASDLAVLDEARIAFLGRKSPLKQALRDVRDRESGMALNEARVAVETALDERQHALESAELERSLRDERVDVTLPGERPPRGHYHLITQIRREVEDLFLGLGYEVYDAPEVDTV